MMNLGLSNDLMISCQKCGGSITLHQELRQNKHTSLTEEYTCRNCGSTFTYIDGIINYFCSDNTFSALSFVSNIVESGLVKIKVGVPQIISLKNNIPIFHKVILSNQKKLFYSFPIYNNNQSSFIIVSSAIHNTINEECAKHEEESEVYWLIYGRTKDLESKAWRQLLVQSKEEYLNEKFLLSFLSVAIALESYINSKLSDYLNSKEIDTKSIDVFLKDSNMIDKAFVLFKSLLQIDPMEVGKLSKTNYQKIIEKRNKIAHGTIVTMEQKEVEETFRTVVTFITYVETKNQK